MASNKQSMSSRRNKQSGKRASVRSGQHNLNSGKRLRAGGKDGNQGKSKSRLATGLGFFSVGLGLAELLAPKGVAKIAGAGEEQTSLIRLYGLRELSSGVGIFLQEKPVESLWARVVGDAIDLATLGIAFGSPEAKKGKLAFATASVAGVTALDVLCALQLSRGGASASSPVQARRSILINRSPEEVYTFWRDLENLPRFMTHLRSVKSISDRRSHWTANAPAGTTVEWDAEITEDSPNRLIAWRSLEGSDVENSGSVIFEKAPGGRGTLVKVAIDYNPPAGVVGTTIAKLFGEEPGQQIADDLRRFKQVMETGEVVVSDATVAGTGYMQQRPAQPSGANQKKESSKTLHARAAGVS